VRDTVNMMRQGVPCVGLVHEPFRKLAGMQITQLRMPDAPILIYPQDLPSKDPPDHVLNKAHEVAGQIVEHVIQAGRHAAGVR
jgi:hypothetical protein